ncbi:MAG: hypothetical protein HC869_24055 [Rhodospirillales bacterium]|nr:hypothetical protein [Rhodospirillales bacterium]
MQQDAERCSRLIDRILVNSINQKFVVVRISRAAEIEVAPPPVTNGRAKLVVRETGSIVTDDAHL